MTKLLVAFTLLCTANAYAIHGYPVPRYCTAASVANGTCLYPGPGVNAELPALSARSTPAWGNTVEQIGSLFAYAQYTNFRDNKNLSAVLTDMDGMMLARLSTELKAHDASDYTASILMYAAEKGTTANLQRLASAFGTARIAAALPYASASVQAEYKALPVLAPLLYSETWWSKGLGATAHDYPGDLYLYDVFLDSYTAGAGGLPGPSIKEMSRYMNYRVKNVVTVIIVVAAVVGIVQGVLAIMDSPTAQTWGNELSDWAFYANLKATIDVDSMTSLTIPAPTLEPPPAPDMPLPTLPPISGDGYDAPTLPCSEGDNGC